MICNKCLSKIYLKDKVVTRCKKCNTVLRGMHKPGYLYCTKCSNSLRVCQQCGRVESRDMENNKNPFCALCDCISCVYKGRCVLGKECTTCTKVERIKNCPVKNGKDYWKQGSNE